MEQSKLNENEQYLIDFLKSYFYSRCPCCGGNIETGHQLFCGLYPYLELQRKEGFNERFNSSI